MSEEGHNRHAIIRSIHAALNDVNLRMEALAVERKQIKGRIKSELGAKVSDFNVLARFVDLEDDSRQELFDLVREGFAALGIGEQGSFLMAFEPKRPGASAPEPAKPEKKKRKTKAEQIAEAVLEDGKPTPEAEEIAQQKAEDEAVFDDPATAAVREFEHA